MDQNIWKGSVIPNFGPLAFNSIRAGCMVMKIPTNSTATSLMALQVKWFSRRMDASVVLKDKKAASRIMAISMTAG